MDARLFVKRNASTILTGLGSIGVLATTITAVKATPKALQLIEEAEQEKGDELTKWEKVKTTTSTYVPAILIGTATVSCIFGAQILNKRQQAALMSAYALLDQSYKDYRRKLKELYGEETHQEIVEALAIEKAETKYINSSYFASNCNLATENRSGETKVFYDEYSQRFFETTIEQVMDAEYHLNRNYILRGYSVLNELYDFLGLEPTESGSIMGWAPQDEGMYWIEFNHRKAELKDGTEFYILEMPFEPSVDYDEY